MDRLIEKYLRGKLADAEKKELGRIFQHYGYHLDDDIPSPAGDMPDVATSARIKQHIMRQRIPRHGKLINWRHIAAAAAVLLGIVGVVAQRSLHQVHPQATPITWSTQSNPGQGVTRVTMPDSSRIWLNAKSSVRYAADYNDTARVIYLQGEAYFEVTKDTLRPFHVYADSMHVTVLGTSFTVSNYPDDALHSVTVVSGRVVSAVSGRSETVRKLKAGDRFQFDRSLGKVRVVGFDPDDALAWREGSLIFNDQDLASIARVLARRYGVTFHFTSTHEQKQKVTLKIPNESLRTVMKVFQSATGIHYQITGQHVTIGNAHSYR